LDGAGWATFTSRLFMAVALMTYVMNKKYFKQFDVSFHFKNVNYSASYFEEPYLDYLKSKEANWSEVLDAVKTKNVGFKTLYVLDYVPFSCGEFTLKMTSDGKASVYGCCGY